MAIMANIHRGKGQRPYSPEEFHPYRQRRKRRKTTYTTDRIAAEHAALASQGPVKVLRISTQQVNDET